ncbi:hypothetical protein IDH41_03960, partial [Paenibacillus sp. IB182493]|nr:hypothetical protein [Paenibacillus arenilitoris]
MKKNIAMLVIAAMAVMLLQQGVFVERVSAADPEPPLYPTKDKFYASGGLSGEGETVLDGDGGANYIGFDDQYGEQVTYLQFSLVNIVRQVESVHLVVPVPNGHVYASNAKGNPFIELHTSQFDEWEEETSELPSPYVSLEKKTFAPSGDTLRFDVTEFIKSQLGSTDDLATFALTGPTAADVNAGAVRHHYIKLSESERLPGNTSVPYLEYIYSPNSPPSGTINIKGGETHSSSTTVTLDLSASDPDGDSIEMEFSNDSTGTWSDKEPFSGSKSWQLSAGEGTKTVHMRLTDSAGNTTEFNDSIILDTTPPVVTGVTNNQFTKQNVSAVFTEGAATLNGSPYTSGTIISAEREHTLIVTDAAGNTNTITFTIDKTAPTVSGVTHNSYSNQPVTITFTEGSATLNSAPFTSGSEVNVDGSYDLVVTDLAGNKSTIHFVIDAAAPTGTLSIEGGKNKTNKNNVDLTITYTDANPVQMRFSNTESDLGNAGWLPVSASHSWNLTPGDSDKTVYMELMDAAGNTNQYSDTITVDTVPPVVTDVNEGDKFNTDVTITFNEGTAELNDSAFISGSTVSSDGDHTLVVTDEAGNITTVNFSIDKTVPSVSGVENGRLYNANVTPVYSDANPGSTATLNGGPGFASGTELTADGDYELVVTDAYGNKTTVHFTIDKTPPAGDLSIEGGDAKTDANSVMLNVTGTDVHAITMEFSNDNMNWSAVESLATTKQWELSAGDGTKTVYMRLTDTAGNTAEFSDTIELDTTAPVVTGVADGEITKEDVTITFNEGTATLKVEPLDAEPFLNNTTVTEDGVYVLIVTDDLGHTTTKTFTIDKKKPIVNEVDNGQKLNADVTITFNEGTAELNGNPFTSGSMVSTDGDYTLVVTDEAGNITTVHFSIDKTEPTVTGVVDGRLYNANVTPVYSDANPGATAILNDTPGFASGTELTADGDYELVVTDGYGNKTTVHFTIDKTPPAGDLSIEGGDAKTDAISVTLNVTGTDAHDILMEFSNDNTNWSPVESLAATKEWELTTGDGTKTVYMRLTDAAGNTAEFSDTIELDTTAPVVTGVVDGEITKEDVTITFNEGTATLK